MKAHIRITAAIAVVTLLTILSTFSSGKTDERTKKEFARFAGKWDVVSVEVDGKKSEGEVSGDKQWSFDPTGYTWQSSGGTSEQGEPALNVGKGQIEFRPKGTSAMNERYYGIYKFDDDTLTVCIGNKPGTGFPSDFKSKAGDDRRLYVLKRAKSN